MKLSVIIPCLNAAGTVATQFEALANQNYSEPWEVIVSDNGSTDEIVDVVKRYEGRLPHLRIVDASDKRGQAHARNIGAKFALGESLSFCDADDEVAPGWLSAMGTESSVRMRRFSISEGPTSFEHITSSCRIDMVPMFNL